MFQVFKLASNRILVIELAIEVVVDVVMEGDGENGIIGTKSCN